MGMGCRTLCAEMSRKKLKKRRLDRVLPLLPVRSRSMDKASHLSVILDLSPSQWHHSAQQDNPYPLSLPDFLSQLLTFLNMHIASKHENTLAVFGAFPGKR